MGRVAETLSEAIDQPSVEDDRYAFREWKQQLFEGRPGSNEKRGRGRPVKGEISD